MHAKLRIIAQGMGAIFLLQGAGFLVVPDRATGSLGMPLLDGLGRSTQLGDFAAFFLTLGASILIGCRAGRRRALYFPAALLGSAALCRTIAWAAQGADFATLFIAAEVLGAALLLMLAGERVGTQRL
jgi:hypothetical protein